MSGVPIHLLFFCYIALFAVITVTLWRWQINRRSEKPPVEFKLLRGPGESLRRRMSKFDEDGPTIFFTAALAPVIVALAVLQLIIWVMPHMQLKTGLIITAIPTLVAVVLAGHYSMQKLSRYRNDRLGYLGERAVGEVLEPLAMAGYRIFHDVPAEAGKAKFNVDHVVVGPKGLFAVETKTRRKGRVRPGFESHKVTYDGRQLIWPWAEDVYGLKNAVDRARWLSDWLNTRTGLTIPAQPVLVLPGWYVISKGIGPVIVVNHKQLHGFISRGTGANLTAQQVDLIARQLGTLCRDVED